MEFYVVQTIKNKIGYYIQYLAIGYKFRKINYLLF